MLPAACKRPKKYEEEIQEVTVSLVVAIEISLDAAVAAVLSLLDGIFTLNEQRMAPKAFLCGQNVLLHS